MPAACQYSACRCLRLEPTGCTGVFDFEQCLWKGQTSSRVNYAFSKCMKSVVFEEIDMGFPQVDISHVLRICYFEEPSF